MPGLVNRSSGASLPLTASEVTSCVSGYAFGMTASLTYGNLETHPFEGLFVYPLDEFTTVVGFEAVISERIVTVQIKDKAKLEDGYFDHCSLSDGSALDGTARIVLDEDLERIVFVANLGIITPLESVTICISTSSELQTLPSGAVQVVLPAVCVPPVPPFCTDSSGFSAQLRGRDRNYSGPKTPDQSSRLCLARLLENEVVNPMEYEFSFQLEIRGPCLLAGVESPTHEIRADADPSAHSAKSIVITLANRHTFDRPVEILIHPSEPHMPHVLMEQGDMTPAEFEQHLKGRSDFIKGTKKDASAERKTEIIRKRLHKDVTHHPVLMLNFCPDLRTVQPDLRKTQGEFLFLIDRSGSMSGVNISRVKDALLVILKSLMPACLFNVIGFGSTFKTLFPSSQTYSEESLATACKNIKRLRADMGGTNILSPLKWIVRQPIHRGHPRLLFLLTDGAVSNTGKVLELVRNHSFSTRCYSFGIGPNACRRLVQGLAAVSKGSAEFLAEGERLQPKMIKSLKKAMAPVLSDVTVEWVFPENTEVLISPVSARYLFPGDRLVGYSIVCDTSLYFSNPRSDKRRCYSMMHSQESGSSVFFHSQEEGAGLDGGSVSKESDGPLHSERTPDLPAFGGDLGRDSDPDTEPDPWLHRRAYSTNQINDREPCKRVPTASDPSAAAAGKNPLRKARVQDLLGQPSPEPRPWQTELQSLVGDRAASGSSSSSGSSPMPRGSGARRPSLLPYSCTSFSRNPDPQEGQRRTPWRGWDQLDTSPGLKSSSDSRSPGDLESTQHPPFTLETETPSDWEAAERERGPGRGWASRPSACRAVVKGLRNSEPLQWEVAFDLGPLFRGQEGRPGADGDLWNETFHHLASRSVIRDFEQLAEQECEIEHGSGRRYQVNAVHTSKACNIISKFTAFVPVDLSHNSYLPTVVAYTGTGVASKGSSQRGSSTGSKKSRGFSIGLGRSQSICGQVALDDGFHSLNLEENSESLCSSPSSSSWEKCSFPDAPLGSPSISTSSPKSSEILFAARLSLNKTRLLTRAAKGFMSRSPTKPTEPPAVESESESMDYLPLVTLQLASGAFVLDSAFCGATSIPMEKLKWTSPFLCHRTSLTSCSHSSSCSASKPLSGRPKSPGPSERESSPIPAASGPPEGPSPRHWSGSAAESLPRGLRAEDGHSPVPLPGRRISSPERPRAASADSGRGSEAESPEPGPGLLGMEQEGRLWATAVALAWLEHSSAAYFIEWELVAAKASTWLSQQEVPEGRTLAAVKAAARQLFVLLRHWDENLEFNLLCYNPNSV
ncbi:von Willebrand factor A domain-containing protein 5B1 [Ornithorhynchus anatinus]|uniref:von Willebrand factor A domain containing 5B1 n=1 Tax=Ornithorhynchus anatinus TaxID=9258 RepID=A0A6I8NK17_ORNAN|nr:von Willebrand factor A domain-containing protein 5B1 [Ornithorhynchus anatinus]